MGYGKIIPVALRVINLLLDYIVKLRKDSNYEKRQKKRHKAAADPGGAFADHFSNRLQSDERDEKASTAGPGSGAEK